MINERFVRWQGRLIEQSAYLNNLTITIGTAVMGFCISLLTETPPFKCTEGAYFNLGLVTLLFSILFGFCGCITRLYDYRTTLKKIKREEEKATESELADLVKIYQTFGRATWMFLYLNVGLLLISIAIIGVVLLQTY
jgi:hypothetical protein